MGTSVLDQGVDASTWQALGLLLTVCGLVVSVVVWRRAGAGHGLRAVAWSLIPLVAGLTGLLRLAWEILDSVLRWATRLVFSPVVWLGLVLLVLAVVLHLAGTVVLRRTPTKTSPSSRDQPQGTSAPTGTPAAPLARGRRGEPAVVDDQDDIEAILRKHGIT
jgi:hypothetical protein